MIFQETWRAVLEGRKWQTRRLYSSKMVYEIGKTYAVQSGRGQPAIWWANAYDLNDKRVGVCVAHETYLAGGNITDWQRAHTEEFCVDGLPHPESWLENNGYQQARILITDRHRDDARNITADDARAEGFENRKFFFDAWLSMHDKPAYQPYSSGDVIPGAAKYLWSRPADRYDVWVYAFRLVGGDA